MKESSSHDPKMEAYYKTVRCLEDKFDDLKLNHIVRKYNKITSGWTTIPPDVFASDLYKPSVDYGKPKREDNQPPEPRLGSDPPEGPNPPRPSSLRSWT
jgi:hypothetical protein